MNKDQIFALKSKPIPRSSLLYASYSSGEYSLHAVDPNTFQNKDTITLYQGWGNRIYKDQKENIWCPITLKPDMTTPEHVVIILNPKNRQIKTINVGNQPEFIFFKGDTTYVVCKEDGINPTIYSIDSSFSSKKLKTVQNGGLLSGAQFDGESFFFNSIITENYKQQAMYPALVKTPLNGSSIFAKLDNQYHGINNLLLIDNRLYMGIQTKDSTLVYYDAKNLKQIGSLPYKDMVGDIIPVDSNTLAVTNFSLRALQGSKVALFNLKKQKVISTFTSQYVVEHLTYLNNKYYVVDNVNHKLQMFNKTWKLEQTVNIPAQVNTILEY